MASRPSRNRRALGDIGNIVGALSTTYIVAKAQNPITQFKNLDKPFGHIARNSGVDHSSNDHVFGKIVDGKEIVRESRTESRKRKRSGTQEIKEPKIVPMMDRDEEKECSSKKKLDRRPSVSSSVSYMSMETPYSDCKQDLLDICEVEMEEAESPVHCIDKLDAENPLAVVEYVDDIYNFYHKTEINGFVPTDYMSIQKDINYKMRAILVDWLIEVHHKFDLMHETLFLAISLIDRYLSRQHVMRKFLQLVGITGMLLACKYEEVCVPLLDDFVYISDRAYTREDILKMEKSILNTLQFNLTVPTSYVFMRRLLKAAESGCKLEMVSFYLLELALVEYQMQKFPPSILSAAAVYAGRCLLRSSPTWSKTLRHYSTYSEDQIQECARLMAGLHQNASQGKLTAVFRKYSVSKYSSIALLMKTQSVEFQSSLKGHGKLE